MSAGGTLHRTRTASPAVQLELLAEDMVSPVALADPVDGTGRLLVADQPGTVWALEPSGRRSDVPFLDLRRRVVRLDPDYDERGLLGLALHPGFRDNQRLYVYYTAPPRRGAPLGWDHTDRLSELEVSPSGQVDLSSERVVLEIDHPYTNHNGGDIRFGPDGFLYVPVGDGGNAADRGRGHNPQVGNAQDLGSLLGKVLRIDVDRGDPYAIPPTNPFARQGGLPEIFAYGLRNPWRISFDRETGELFAGDVGQYLHEEIDLLVPGANYGWNIKEGHHCFDPERPFQHRGACLNEGYRGEPLHDPIVEYGNAAAPGGIGTAVIGGYMYRGKAMAHLRDRYLFGDWSRSADRPDGSLFVAARGEDGRWTMEEVAVRDRRGGRLGEHVLAFGEDGDGELYLMTSGRMGPSGSTGKVYRLL